MKLLLLTLVVSLSNLAFAKDQTRCGWINNPTPGNYWLDDADGQWIIASQGSYQAEGDIENYPTDDQKVNTNGNYGYWCGCVTGTYNSEEGQVTKVVSSLVKNLDKCLEDPKLNLPIK